MQTQHRADGRLGRRTRTCGPRRLRASSSTSRTSTRARASGRRSASRRSGSRSATRSRRATSRFACASSNKPNSSISCPTTATTWRPSRRGSSARKKWYCDYGVRAERLRFYELTQAGAAALRESRHRRRVSLPVGLGRTRIDRASRHLRSRRAHEALRQGSALLRRSREDALHADPHRELGRHGPHDADDADRRLRARDVVDPSGKETKRVVLRFHPKIAPVQVGVFPLARNKPELVERARRIEARSARRASARSTTKATSASSIAAKTRSARRSASWSTTRRSTTARSRCASATRCGRNAVARRPAGRLPARNDFSEDVKTRRWR